MSRSPKTRLAALLDGELSEDEQRELEAELEDNPELREALESQREAKEILGTTASPILNEDISRSAMSEIRSRKRSRDSMRNRLTKIAVGVAAALGVAVTVYSLMPAADNQGQMAQSGSSSESAMIHDELPEDIYLDLEEAVERPRQNSQGLKETVFSLHQIRRANWATQRGSSGPGRLITTPRKSEPVTESEAEPRSE